MPKVEGGTDHAERNIAHYLKRHPELVVLSVGADKGVCWTTDGIGGCAVILDDVNNRTPYPMPGPLYTKRTRGEASAKEVKVQNEKKGMKSIESYFIRK